MREERDYHLIDPTWCGGCGIYGIFAALKKAATKLELDPEHMVTVTGIGCHGRLNNYLKSYGFHALHGRTLPVASGIKLANPSLTVLAVSGDGDAYSIGLGHFLHAVRRNINLTYIVVDNRIYALTQGQTSPTSQKGFVSKSTPYGSVETPLNGPQIALASEGTFVARGFSGEPGQLTSLIEEGMRHNGFSLIEVLSPCITHNKINTYQWFKNNIYRIDEERSYDPGSRTQAWNMLIQSERIPVGLIYKKERPSFEALSLPGRDPIVYNQLQIDETKLEKILERFE